tara:strand:+ start:6713 stop:6964 length:252 start_codon:yes stop_codon:yes gene_type:complete
MRETYYKFKVTTLETNQVNYYYKYKDLYQDTSIPRSTLYKILDGATSSKFLERYKVERCKLPRHVLVEYPREIDTLVHTMVGS